MFLNIKGKNSKTQFILRLASLVQDRQITNKFQILNLKTQTFNGIALKIFLNSVASVINFWTSFLNSSEFALRRPGRATATEW